MQKTLVLDLIRHDGSRTLHAPVRSRWQDIRALRRSGWRCSRRRRRRERLEEKRYLYDTLYTCPALDLEHTKAEEVVTELFEFWVNEPEELPEAYFAEVESEGLARVVADYIAGMTDNFILLQYAEVRRRVRSGMAPLRSRASSCTSSRFDSTVCSLLA